MIAFTVLIILLIVWLVRNFGADGTVTRTTSCEKTPLEILKECYAKGKIDRAEFEQKKKDLV